MPTVGLLAYVCLNMHASVQHWLLSRTVTTVGGFHERLNCSDVRMLQQLHHITCRSSDTKALDKDYRPILAPSAVQALPEPLAM